MTTATKTVWDSQASRPNDNAMRGTFMGALVSQQLMSPCANVPAQNVDPGKFSTVSP
jgi:hypothetical protein